MPRLHTKDIHCCAFYLAAFGCAIGKIAFNIKRISEAVKAAALFIEVGGNAEKRPLVKLHYPNLIRRAHGKPKHKRAKRGGNHRKTQLFCAALDFFYAYRIFIILPCCRALVVHAPSRQSSSQLTLTLCSMGFHSTWAKIAAKEIGM